MLGATSCYGSMARIRRTKKASAGELTSAMPSTSAEKFAVLRCPTGAAAETAGLAWASVSAALTTVGG